MRCETFFRWLPYGQIAFAQLIVIVWTVLIAEGHARGGDLTMLPTWIIAAGANAGSAFLHFMFRDRILENVRAWDDDGVRMWGSKR